MMISILWPAAFSLLKKAPVHDRSKLSGQSKDSVPVDPPTATRTLPKQLIKIIAAEAVKIDRVEIRGCRSAARRVAPSA
jgi:hypothetical protein